MSAVGSSVQLLVCTRLNAERPRRPVRYCWLFRYIKQENLNFLISLRDSLACECSRYLGRVLGPVVLCLMPKVWNSSP